ncbi:hypothetical protein CVT24_004147 [Panaeolus cyanescens]|uniref:SAP domain-containing protein n=1 Tax=Panaeolus cyanescens TaxID=181874 RepID=A0A409Y6Q9_9AGAR|nr:hypothetical protein CVT24_004147 [Panaeolus cyanescens]
MAQVAYSGALPSKKKSELQEIALALRLSDQGTKDELQSRIRKHLDRNQEELEENPTFTGLFSRKRRTGSLVPQPQAAPPPSTRFAPSIPTTGAGDSAKPSSSVRRPLDPIREGTPVKDLRDVSQFLKHPFSPVQDSPESSPRQAAQQAPATPSSLPPLPPSPAKSLIEHIPNAASNVRAAVEHIKQQEVLQNGNELLIALRAFLSNSRNIWSLTAVFELLYVIYSAVPWSYVQVPLAPRKDQWVVSIAYPPLSTFQASAFWLTLFHWAIPTLIVPTVLGSLISFSPVAPSPPPTGSETPAQPVAPLDPLTASIIRLVAQIAYPYESLSARNNIVGLDVLGPNGRVLSASTGLAFAFAEAIQGAPKVFAKTLVAEQRKAIAFGTEEDSSSTRRRLMPAEDVSAEVD